MSGILTEIINIIVSGLTSYGQGIGGALSSIATAMFIDNTGSSPALSVFGGLVCVFAGLALAIGITRLVFGWLSSLGNKN